MWSRTNIMGRGWASNACFHSWISLQSCELSEMWIYFCAFKVARVVTNLSLAWLWQWLWTIDGIHWSERFIETIRQSERKLPNHSPADVNHCTKIVTFTSKAVKQFCMQGKQWRWQWRTYKGIDGEYLSMLCPRPVNWVIAAWTFLSAQGATVQTVILPKKLQVSRVMQYSYSFQSSLVTVMH